MVQKNFIGLCSEYTDFFSMFMSELIGWAEFGEDKCIRWKKIKLKRKLLRYRQYLLENHSLNSVRTFFYPIIYIYKYFEICED